MIDYKHQEALDLIKQEEQSKSIKYDKELGLVIKGVIFQELGKMVDLENLYHEMVALGGRDMNTTKTEAVMRVNNMQQEVMLERKKKTGSEFCK